MGCYLQGTEVGWDGQGTEGVAGCVPRGEEAVLVDTHEASWRGPVVRDLCTVVALARRPCRAGLEGAGRLNGGSAAELNRHNVLVAGLPFIRALKALRVASRHAPTAEPSD